MAAECGSYIVDESISRCASEIDVGATDYAGYKMELNNSDVGESHTANKCRFRPR